MGCGVDGDDGISGGQLGAVELPQVDVVAAHGVVEEVAVGAVAGEVAGDGHARGGVALADGEVDVVLLAVEAAADGFGALPAVALSDGAVDIVATLAARAVAAEVEHAVGLVVEGRYVVVGAVDLRAEVDAFAGDAVADERVPDVHAADAAGSVADEVEDDGAVGQTSDGGVRGCVFVAVGFAAQELRFAPSAFLLLGPPYLAAQVGVAHAAACEV